MIYVVICLLLWRTDFLRDNYLVLDFIDTILTALMIIHAIKNYDAYYKTSKNCLWGVLTIVFINRIDIDFAMRDVVYFWSYVLIVCIVIVKSILDNRQR